MKKILSPLAVIALTLMLSACGYDGHYRYPCQDPANWEAKECNPPICEATGMCTKDLIAQSSTSQDSTIDTTTQEPGE